MSGYSLVRLTPTAELLVNGQRRALISGDATTGAEVIVATGTVVVLPTDGTVYGGEAVTVRCGHNGKLVDTITGTVVGESIKHGPRGLQFQIVGRLDAARHAIGVPPLPDDAVTEDEDGNPIPAASFAELTDGAIVMALLDLAGVAYDASQIAENGTVLGTVEPVVLAQGQAPLDLIRQIDEDYRCRTYELPDGTIRRVVWTGKPAGSPGLVLRGGVDFQEGTREIQLDGMYNRINVRGLEQDLGTPRATVQADSRVNPRTGKPYIGDPPKYRATDHSSPLLETADACEAFGRDFIGEHNRLQERVAGRTIPAMPWLVGGMSLFLLSADLELTQASVFRIGNVHTQIGQQGLQTDLTLIGGYAAEGVNPNVKPTPTFTITVVREHIAGQGDIFVVVADGSGSFDAEGAYQLDPVVNEVGQEVPGVAFNGIFGYAWSSTLAGEPQLMKKGARAIWTVDSNPTGKTITLTVSDSQLQTASLTKPIVATDDAQPLVRDLWLAVSSELLYTNDGERTWKHIPIPAVFIPEQCADTFTLALTADGLAYKVTTVGAGNGAVQIPIAGAPTNATAAYIAWRYPSSVVLGERCWLGAADGGIWFSADFAATWIRRGTVPGGARIEALQESPFAENDVYATAGNKLYHSFDGGAVWEVVYAHPNAALVATKPAAGFQHMFVAFRGASPATDPGLEASRIKERANQVQGDWSRQTTPTSLPPGQYRVAYSYRGAGGETPLSPARLVTVAAGQVIRVSPVTPLIQGATGVYYYCSQTAGSSIMRRVAEDTGADDLTIDVAPAAGLGPALTNTTLAGLATPATPPAATALAATAAAIDFPAQPAALAMGVYEPDLYALGTAHDGAAHSWYADASASFTFRRGVWDGAQFGAGADLYRDGLIENIVYWIAERAAGKTTTGFQGDAFTFLPLVAPQVGRKIGIGKIGPAPPPKGDAVWLAHGINQNSIIRVMALTDGGFADRGLHPLSGIQNLPVVRLYASAPGVLLSLVRNNEGFAQDKPSPLGAAPNNTHYSLDGGVTWQETSLQYCSWISIGLGGNCAAVCWEDMTQSNNPADDNAELSSAYIYTSADGGITWAQRAHWIPFEFTHQGRAPAQVEINPQDPTHLMVRHGQSWLSVDGGATFDPSPRVATASQAGLGSGAISHYTVDGVNWLWYDLEPSATPLNIAPEAGPYSPTPVVAGDGTPTSGQAYLFTMHAGALYMYGSGGGAWRIGNTGTSEIIFQGIVNNSVGTNGDYAADSYVAGFLPGDNANDWLVFKGNTLPGHTILRLAAGEDPLLAERWESLQVALDALGVTGGQYICWNGAAARVSAGG